MASVQWVALVIAAARSGSRECCTLTDDLPKPGRRRRSSASESSTETPSPSAPATPGGGDRERAAQRLVGVV